MAKTVAKFLWQGYILIFRALAKLLSDWGATFESNIISEQHEFIGIWKVRTLLYHPQTNRQLEWAHQTLMQMIGKLGNDWKADWPKHIQELVHTYNSMRLAITGYSPHYLMFGWWLHLPIDFYFPTIVSTEKHQHVDHYIADLFEWLHEAFKEAQVQSSSEAEKQRWYYDIRPMPFHWNQVSWSWQKPTPTKGGERWKTGRRRNHMKWNVGLLKASLHTSWRTSRPDAHESFIGIDFFSSPPQWELLYVQAYELSGQGAPPPSWRNLLGKWVRMRKCCRVPSVCCQPSARQVRLL